MPPWERRVMAFRDWQDTEAADRWCCPSTARHTSIPQLGTSTRSGCGRNFARVKAGERPLMSNEDFLAVVLATSSRRCARTTSPRGPSCTLPPSRTPTRSSAARPPNRCGSTAQTASRSGSGDNGGQRKFDHLARYGRGRIIDEETGEYETYDVPDGEGRSFDWAEILDAPRLIAAELPVEYGIDLATLGNELSWREFATYVEGLLACDSRLARHLNADTDDAEEVER